MKLLILLLCTLNIHNIIASDALTEYLNDSSDIDEEVLKKLVFDMMMESWHHGGTLPVQELTPKQLAWWNSLGARHTDAKKVPLVRKEYRELTKEEQQRYFAAILDTMYTYPDEDDPDTSEYVIFVIMHTRESAPGAHTGPGFAPWHREFLFRYETALQERDPKITLAYWDSALDQTLPDPKDSTLWSDEHFGNCVGINVTSGPFAYFPVPQHCTLYGETLTRAAVNGKILHYTRESIGWTFEQESYNDLSCLIDPNCTFESYHGFPHAFFSSNNSVGHMRQVLCSPSDPIFWSHHSFIDLIWEEFRQNNQTTNPVTDYPTDEDGFILPAHKWNSSMSPFEPMINFDGMTDEYTKEYYTYTRRPSSIVCSDDSECANGALWCNTETGHCTGKVQPGGRCGTALTGALPNTACGNCVENEVGHCNPETFQCECLSMSHKNVIKRLN